MSYLNNPITQFGVQEVGNLFLSPSGGKVFYVGTAAMVANYSDVGQAIASRLFTDVNTALAQCVSGRGDVIYVLPNYTENIATADAWSNLGTTADVSIVGMGRGSNRPGFTWTTNASSILFDQASFQITNCRLNLEPTTGTVTVAAPITVTGQGCAITNCWIAAGTDANNKITIGVTVSSGGNNFEFAYNRVRGAAAATMTTFLRLDGVTNPYVHHNDIMCGTTAAAVGPIQELNTACTGINVSDNAIQNNAASSTACITIALANSTGWIMRNMCRNMTDANNAEIVVTSGDMQLFENRGVNNSNENGISIGTNSA
jgi:hypothetical protein